LILGKRINFTGKEKPRQLSFSALRGKFGLIKNVNMAVVSASATIGGFIYTFPLPRFMRLQKLIDIQNILLPIAEFLTKEFPGKEEIYITWNNEKENGKIKDPIAFYSPTIPAKEIMDLFEQFKADIAI
jgi:hypothetical protein